MGISFMGLKGFALISKACRIRIKRKVSFVARKAWGHACFAGGRTLEEIPPPSGTKLEAEQEFSTPRHLPL